jgi:hypothetical protein
MTPQAEAWPKLARNLLATLGDASPREVALAAQALERELMARDVRQRLLAEYDPPERG